MSVALIELSNASYRTTRAADAQCSELLIRLGWKVRYLPARLAIARSLSLPSPPPELSGEDDEELSSPIRGLQLFGDGADPSAWLALISQRSGDRDLTRKKFQTLVAAHWKRGAALLTRDWEESNGNLAQFVSRLAELASLSGPGGEATGSLPDGPEIGGEVVLPVGEIAEDVQTGETINFPLNAAGGSPHMAIMGGAGSGKTDSPAHAGQAA